jgi:serine/threonine protein kinase
MGEVYKATDTRLGRTVAIKLLRSAHTDRFEREARAIATALEGKLAGAPIMTKLNAL